MILDFLGSVEAFYDQYVLPDIPNAHDLSVVIDGTPVAALENGNLHYVNFVRDGDELIVPITSANLVPGFGPDWEIGGYEYSLLLAPLPPGQHVIEMKVKGGGGFESNVTYYLTVEPGKK